MSLHNDMDPVLRSARNEVPVLATRVYDKPLVYLDNAATTQKPQAVIDAVSDFYERINSNVHRGVHKLSQDATAAYENAREIVRSHLGARSSKEIIFTRGTTESVNLVAHSFGSMSIRSGDEIVITHMEHHSNIVPWQMLCERSGAVLRVIPVNDRGELEIDTLQSHIGPATKLVSVVAMSNALGTINPLRAIIDVAHAVGAKVMIDAAQAMAHMQLDVVDLDCDFLAFSGHKVYAPTGIGVLYAKEELLSAMPPFMGGGDMIERVSFEKTSYAGLPNKFEAGTPNISGAIGLGAALAYMQRLGYDRIQRHEQALLRYGTERLHEVKGLRIVGTAAEKGSVFSFVIDGIHPHDIGTFLDREGIAVRAGHHCVQPLMKRFGISATTRISCAWYSTFEELDASIDALHGVVSFFGVSR